MARAPGIVQVLPLPYGEFGKQLRDPLGYLLRARERFGDVFRCRIGPLLVHVLFHPDHVRQVLYEQQKNYLRGWHYRMTRRLIGNNLVVSEGPFWLRQRRLAQEAFSRERLAAYADVMVDAAACMLDRWRSAPAEDCRTGTPSAGMVIDIAREMTRVTLAIAGRTLFSRDVSDEADAVGRAFGVVARHFEARFNRPFTSWPGWAPVPANMRVRRAVRTLNEIVLGLIRDRRRDGQERSDLLSILMQARDEETGESMSDDELRGELLTFLMAGHETTATALAWTLYLLASHAEIQQRARAEAAAVLGDRRPTFADAACLPLARMAIEEAMRLYPPIWAIPRQAVRNDEIAGYRIPARSTVALCPYVTHRHPDFWERPHEFDPEHFSAARAAQRPKGAYFPFLGGAHQCIGNEFAMLEMRLILAMVLRQFELDLAPGQAIEPKASITLRPNGPVQVMLRRIASPVGCS
jgi:cytochrome P450